jgi:hypothetical protein
MMSSVHKVRRPTLALRSRCALLGAGGTRACPRAFLRAYRDVVRAVLRALEESDRSGRPSAER